MNITEITAISKLTEYLRCEQDFHSRNTGFGYGFNRWILSIHLAESLGISFAECRKLFKSLERLNIVDMKSSRSRGLLEFSTKGWQDCKIIGDYFIENDEDTER